MPYLSTQTVIRRFPVTDLTGAAVDADSTPVGVVIKNGSAIGTTVTVTRITTGKYSASFVMPTVAAGDTFELEVTAVVGGTTLAPFYWFIDSGVTTASLVVAPPTASENADAVLAALAVDGQGFAAWARDVWAGAIGVTGVTLNGNGTVTIAFKARDGTTTVRTLTYNPATGARS